MRLLAVIVTSIFLVLNQSKNADGYPIGISEISSFQMEHKSNPRHLDGSSESTCECIDFFAQADDTTRLKICNYEQNLSDLYPTYDTIEIPTSSSIKIRLFEYVEIPNANILQGDYDASDSPIDLSGKTIKNVKFISEAPKEKCIKVYSWTDFNGEQLEICNDIEDLSQVTMCASSNWDEKISSIKTSSNTDLIAFKDANFEGDSLLIQGNMPMLDLFDNKISSLKLIINTDACESDTTSPVIKCPTDRLVAVNNMCKLTINDYSVDLRIEDNCSKKYLIRQFPTEGTVMTGIGTYTIGLTVSDESSNISTCEFNIIAVDKTPPTASLTAFPKIIAKNDGSDVKVTVSGAVSDNCDPDAQCSITGITDNNLYSSKQYTYTSDSAYLVSSLSYNRVPRVYDIANQCSDSQGNISNYHVFVVVPIVK